MKKLSLSSILFLFLVFQGLAQHQIVLDKQLLLNASTAGPEASRNLQWVYYSIVNEGNNTNKPKNNISWDFTAALSLNATPYQTALINFEFERIHLLQQVLFRKVDISALIKPDIFRGQFQLISDDGKIWQRPFEIQVSNDVPIVKQLSHVDLLAENQSFKQATVTDFDFSTQVRQQIENAVHQINRYYGSLNLFENLENTITKETDETDPISLFLSFDIIRKAISLNENIVNQEDDLFSANQKEAFLKSLEILRRKQTRYETLLNEFFNPQKAFAFRSIDIVEAYNQKLLTYKHLATTVDFRDYEVYYKLYGIQADTAFHKKIEQFETYFSKHSLSREIIKVLLDEIEKLLSKGDYANAYFLSDQLFASGLSNMTGYKEQQITEQLSLSRAGVLESYFQINNKALEANNEKMAALYFSKSKDFFKTAFENIPDNNTRLVATNLIGNYQTKANELLQLQQTDKAIQYLNQAWEAAFLYDNKPMQIALKNTLNIAHQQKFDQLIQNAVAFNDGGASGQALLELVKADSYYNQYAGYIGHTANFEQLKQTLGEPIFSNKIQSGINAAKLGNTDAALRNLAEANQLENTTDYVSNREGEITNELAKPLIIEKIRTANKQVWANKLDEAWEIYHNAQMISEEFKLQNDPEIMDVFSKLDARIIERICMNNQQAYDELMLAAERAVRFEKISDLQRSLAEARNLVDKNRGCNIQTDALANYEKLFESSFDYWKRYQNMLDIMYANGFEAAIPAYLELDRQAANYDFSELGNPHKDMQTFLTGQKNPTLTVLATNYFIAEQDYKSAKKYFQLFISQNPDQKLFKAEIEYTATVFAAYDSQNSGGKSSEVLLQDYNPQILEYKNFIKNYKRHF